VLESVEANWDSEGSVGPGGGDKCAWVFSVRHSGVFCETQASRADTYQSGALERRAKEFVEFDANETAPDVGELPPAVAYLANS
jgi:hypothetical protein